MGRSLLDERYTPRRAGSGAVATVRESVRLAVQWIVRALEASDTGLLEFQRMTRRGHRFQAWKDGTTSYLHTDGTFANYNGPIASIEVQGLAYDALVAAPLLLDDSTPTQRERWVTLSQRLRDAVMELFWMPEERYFAMALDRDPTSGALRQIRTLTSNPGALLDSGIFDTLPEGDRERAVGAIVERIYSEEFLAPAGVRCNSLAHLSLLDYMAYQSSYTVWHKETHDIACGLRRQGFPALARDLEARLLNAVNLVGGATEFLYVMPDGRVDWDPFGRRARTGAEEIYGTNVPENDQAWSISAALAIKWRRGHGLDGGVATGWQRGIEERKERTVRAVPVLRTFSDIKRELEGAEALTLNTEEGWRRESAFVRRQELAGSDA
jgi:glycogen debranching enzyme